MATDHDELTDYYRAEEEANEALLDEAEEDSTTYKVVCFCFDEDDPRHREVIRTGLTLAEAQAHCQDEATHGDGWFHGYDEE